MTTRDARVKRLVRIPVNDVAIPCRLMRVCLHTGSLSDSCFGSRAIRASRPGPITAHLGEGGGRNGIVTLLSVQLRMRRDVAVYMNLCQVRQSLFPRWGNMAFRCRAVPQNQ